MSLCFYCELPMKDASMTNTEARELLCVHKGQHRSKLLLKYMRKTDEHLIRKADGGTDCKDNIVFAHMYCNSSRGDNSVAGHKEIMMAKVAGGMHPLISLRKAQ